MELRIIGSNQTELNINSVGTVLFSYNTPVAARTPEGCYKTSTFYSVTTSKHINAWGGKNWKEVDQSVLDNLVK